MENQVSSLLDHHRWLLNMGVMPDIVKNNLFMYGSLVHKGILAVDLDIDPASKHLTYKLYVDKALLKRIDRFNKLRQSNSLFSLWRLKRLLLKEGNLDFKFLLNNFIKDYCGPTWNVSLELIDYTHYKERDHAEEGLY